MLEIFKTFFIQRATQWKWLTILLSLAASIVLGSVDYLTGRELLILPFYLAPICWTTWIAGRKAGLLLAITSAGIWLLADMMARFVYPHALVPYWNALMLVALYVPAVFLLSALHDAHHKMEETVARRTAELQAEIAIRKRMETAKIQSERLAAIGTMAASMAHEIRNPLGSIVLNLDLIKTEVEKLFVTSQHPADEGRLLVNEMRAEVRRIQHVLEDYLQFARMSKPRLKMLNVCDMLSHRLAFMQGAFDKGGIRLHTAFDPSVTSIEADEEQLWQATLNLIRNSMEAMPDGGDLTIGTERHEAQVAVVVRDNGQGMAEDQRQHVFAPFFTTKKSGTGLGLALVQQIVTEHGGYVECESTLGQGSTFAIFLPLRRTP